MMTHHLMLHTGSYPVVTYRLLRGHVCTCAISFAAGCRGKRSKTSDMGMYGTSKLYLLMATKALQQRLQVQCVHSPNPIVFAA